VPASSPLFQGELGASALTFAEHLAAGINCVAGARDLDVTAMPSNATVAIVVLVCQAASRARAGEGLFGLGGKAADSNENQLDCPLAGRARL
jgi:hypothetical protein